MLTPPLPHGPFSPTTLSPIRGEVPSNPEPQPAVNIDPNILTQLLMNQAANGQRRRINRKLAYTKDDLHADAQAQIDALTQEGMAEFIRSKPGQTRPQTPYVDPAVAPTREPQPARILDYITPPLGPVAAPEVSGGPSDPFDQVVFGGLRRHIENWRRRRSAEKLEKARREQNFYRSIAHVALVEAGFTELPQGFEPVIVYNPDSPETQPRNRKQRKHKKDILGKNTKTWKIRGHVIKKSRHKPGFVNNLKATHKSKSVADWASREQQVARGKQQVARDPHMIDRQRLIEVVQQPYLEKLAARDEKIKEYHEIPDTDTVSKNAVYAEVLAAQDEATQSYIDLLPEYFRTAQAVEQRYPYEPYVDKQTKHSKKINRKHRRQLKYLLHETEGGRDGRHRNKKIRKWNRKASSAPVKAQERVEKLQNKVTRKNTKRFLKQVRKDPTIQTMV